MPVAELSSVVVGAVGLVVVEAVALALAVPCKWARLQHWWSAIFEKFQLGWRLIKVSTETKKLTNLGNT